VFTTSSVEIDPFRSIFFVMLLEAPSKADASEKVVGSEEAAAPILIYFYGFRFFVLCHCA
jgi:hypothetical protein